MICLWQNTCKILTLKIIRQWWAKLKMMKVDVGI
jgi:hypothetical protein